MLLLIVCVAIRHPEFATLFGNNHDADVCENRRIVYQQTGSLCDPVGPLGSSSGRFRTIRVIAVPENLAPRDRIAGSLNNEL